MLACAVVPGVLKGIGFVLLFLLLLLLLALALILFLPIRYEAAGRAEPSDTRLQAGVLFFLGALSVRAEVTRETFRLRVRVLGRSVLQRRRRFAAKRAGEKEASPEGEPAQNAETEGETPPPGSEAGESPAPERMKEETPPSESRASRTSEREEKEPIPPESGGEEPQPDRAGKRETQASEKKTAGASGKKSGEKGPKRKNTEEDKERPKRETNRLRSLWTQLHDPVNREILALVRKRGGKILHHVLPRTLRVKGVLGTGDPAGTGQILGLFYMLLPLWYGKGEWELAGDFENRTLQGRLFLRGRIIPGYILTEGLFLLMNRKVRLRIRQWLQK